MSPAIALGARLHALRSARGWTLAELAARAGVSRSMLGEIERGRRAPTINVVARIARGLELAVDAVLGLEAPAVTIVRRPGAFACGVRALAPAAGTRLAALYEIIVDGGARLEAPLPIAADATDTFTVAAGAVVAELERERHALASGDTLVVSGGDPLALVNDGAAPATLYVVRRSA